jgi:CHAT domain-containing protein/Tfp pilus assembly protein PilF
MLKFIPLSVCVVCLLHLTVPAQTTTAASSSSPTIKEAQLTATEVLAHARELYSTEGPKVALPEFEKALALFQKESDKKHEAITLGLIGNCYKKFGDFPKAEDYLQRALKLKRAIGDRAEEGKTLSHLGLLHWEMSDYKQATDYYNQAIAIAQKLQDRVIEASVRNNLGLVLDEIGNYRLSLDQYNRALQLYQLAQSQLGTNDTVERGISDVIGNIGGDHLLLGDFGEALKSYQESLSIDERLELKPGICLDLQNIGLSLIGLGRLPEALQAFDQSIALAGEGGLKKEEADSRKGKGSALLQLGKYDQARNEYRKALQVYEQVEGLKQNLVEGLGDLGDLELRLGDAASAEKDFRRALDLARAINHPRGVTVNLIALGDIEWRRKRFNEASQLYREALARAIEAKDRGSETSARIQLALTLRSLDRLEDAAKEAEQASEIARATQARLLEAEALYAQGDVARAGNQPQSALKYFAAGKEIATTTNNPELSWRLDFGRGQAYEGLKQNTEALTAYYDAVKVIEQVRGELSQARFRAGYIEDKYEVYVALVRLLLTMGKTDEAFLFSEKLRARSYLDLFGNNQAPVRSEAQRRTETGLRNRIRELQRRLEAEAAKPSPERRGDAFDLFSKELAEAEGEYANFLDDLRSADPSYAAMRALRVPTSDEVKQRLPADTALVEYVMAEDSLEIFVLTATELRAKSVPVRAADLRNKVEFLRDVLLRKNTEEWKLPAESLYQILIGPIESAGWLRGIRNVYIVPHSVLHYVPFAVLARPNRTASASERQSVSPSSSGRGRTEHVLIDDYLLAYLPAAAALVYGGKASTSNNSILAMAPASTRLRYAQQESQNVSNFFPNQHLLLLGSRATESSFKRLAGQYDVIHLSTHGYFNKLNPLLSGVELESDAQEDGRLEVHEILGLRLKAKLVTLSACDTALGSGYFAEVPAGDDLVGLTRAFLFAGTPSIMASLWEVNDLSAVRLMNNFYRGLEQSDKATALANAQREMRTRGMYRHPYYWAPFVMVGQMK